MSQIAQNYIDANKKRKEMEAAFDEALKRQYGPYATIHNTPDKPDWNPETLAAFNAMHDAISAQFRARSIAHDNGGDFALPIEEVKEHGQ